MLDLTRLRALHAVATFGTVTAAAGALHCTPSAISQHLAKLERETRATLVEKDGRGIRLTEAGRILVEHAGRVLAAVEEAEAALAAQQETGKVTVRIGHETEAEQMVGTSVVTTTYGSSGTVFGGMGVLGPTRMDYPGTIANVAAVALYIGEVLGSR